MQQLAHCLRIFLEDYFRDALLRTPDSALRPILVGPPREALKHLFELMTCHCQEDWEVCASGRDYSVAILWIDDGISERQLPLRSQRCSWDYAVTVRNSAKHALCLVSPDRLDAMPESIANTTDLIRAADCARGRWSSDRIWSHLATHIASNLGATEHIVKALFERTVLRRRDELEPRLLRRWAWVVADQLLQPLPPPTTPLTAMAAAAGLPSCQGTAMTSELLIESTNIIERLGTFLEKHGLSDGLELLKATDAGRQQAVMEALDGLARHVLDRAGSGLAFSRAPTWYFRPDSATSQWWLNLDVEVLNCMLQQVGVSDGPSLPKLSITCANRLDGGNSTKGEPAIVSRLVELSVMAPGGEVPTLTRVDRIVGPSRQNLSIDTQRAGVYADNCNDASLQLFGKPFRYECMADGFRPAAIDVIVLDWFACQGVARVREAKANGYPKKPQRQREADWRQEVRVSRAGVHDLEVFHSCRAAVIEVWNDMGLIESRAATNPTRFIVEGVEHNSELRVVLKHQDGQQIGSWIIGFSVDEQDARTVPTRFDALVLAHQEKRGIGPVQPRDSLLRSIEEAYLACKESWRPVLACWDSALGTPRSIDWEDRQLGAIRPQSDPRPPSITVPGQLISTRAAIQGILRQEARSLVEIDLAKLRVELEPHITAYLEAYMRWITQASGEAMWFDCIVIHAPEDNPQAGCMTASTEPLAIALSPLHPLRIGWQYLAQVELTESLRSPCPAAGLLDPHGCPSIGAWPLSSGGDDNTARAFFAIGTLDPYWAVLLNKQYLPLMARSGAPDILGQLGFGYRGLVGRFTKSQTMGALDEVTKILSTRSILRVGIVGAGQATSECVEGIVDWCDLHLADERDGLDQPSTALSSPRAVEIIDETPSPSGASHGLALSSERIASLSERSDGRVKWFARTAEGSRPEDLVIVDQLGVHNPQGVAGESRSPIGRGVLYRSRLSEDAQNGWWLTEARIAKRRRSSPGLAGLLEQVTALFEDTAVQDHGISHLRFHPNQEAIGSRLTHARFLAITSSHVDPACLTRSVEAQDGLVWDYEVPGALGTEDKTAGYYLITKSSPAMKVAVSRAAQLVAEDPPPADALLREISRRGIPVLKRMTSGGSASRGELGMLLAVRLLQDAFREGATLPPRLPVYGGDCIHMIIPVDPLETPLARMAHALRQRSSRHPDLLVLAIRNPAGQEGQVVSVKVTPLEVKFRASRMSPRDLADGLSQAAALGELLTDLWVEKSPHQLWTTCAAAFLAQMLEHGFRIYADEHVHHLTPHEWRRMQESVLQAVLCGDAHVRVARAGRLIVFDDSDGSSAVDMDDDGQRDTAIICRTDAGALLLGKEAISPGANEAVALLDFSCDARLQAGPSTLPTSDVDGRVAAAREECSPAGASTPSVPCLGHPALPDAGALPSQDQGDDGSAEAEPNTEQLLIPTEIRHKVDQAFAGFIGNEQAVATLKRSLLRALTQTPPYLDKNFLLVGQPSTGKTELAKRMAMALGLPLVHVDGPAARTREKLFELIDATLAEAGRPAQGVGTRSGLPLFEYPPVVIFVDEIHLMPRKTQEALLTLLERSDRTVTLEGSQPRVARVPCGTFLFATTRPSELDKPFRSRCLEVALERYTRAEVAQIVALVRPDWPTEVLLQLATYARLVPRIAITLAKELEDEILASHDRSRSIMEHLARVAHSMGIIDERGLHEIDIRYLEALQRAARPLGETAILNMLGSVDREAILQEVEPYLIRDLGFVTLTRQGREITQKGRDFILERRKRGLNLKSGN